MVVFCLDCDHAINLEFPLQEGDYLTCSICGTRLEVINLDPLQLDWIYEKSRADSVKLMNGQLNWSDLYSSLT
jgi:hypothetical protein